MTFYTRNSARPAPLPAKVITPEGRVRTATEQWTADELAAWGFVEAPEQPDYDPETERVEWYPDLSDWVIEQLPPPPEPVTLPPTLFAAAQLRIENGEVFGVGINSRLAGAFILDVGQYYVMFVEPMPDTEYMAMATAIGPCSAYVLPTNKFADAFIITVSNSAGEPADVEAVNVSIVRA